MHIDNVPHVIVACCVLHNMCEIHHEGFNEEWLQEADFYQPENHTTAESPSGHGGDQIREVLMEYFDHNYHKNLDVILYLSMYLSQKILITTDYYCTIIILSNHSYYESFHSS